MRVKSALIGFLPLLFFSPIAAFAAPEDFVISEIMYDPAGSDTDKEWVEVFHDASLSATIQGGSSSKALKFFDGSGSSGNHNLGSTAYQGSMTIEPKSYLVLVRDGLIFKSLYPSFNGTVIEVSMSLGNDKETVGFKNGSSGNLFSAVTYEKSWGGNNSGKSLEKKDRLGANDGTNWVQSSVDGGTPGEAYKEPEKATYPDTVKINEFLPDPKSGDEWVELYNSSSSLTAVMTNWQLDDEEGGVSPKSFTTSIQPFGYYTYYFTASTLNNDGDTARLIKPDGTVFDSFNYTKSQKGFSYALFDGAFAQTSSPTSGGKNVLVGDPDLFEGSIVDIKKLPLGHKVTLTAVVSSPPNLLGDKELYLWNQDGSGIKVSYTQTPGSDLKVGDKVKVASTIEESYNEKYIKTESVSLVQAQAINVEENSILTGEVSEPYEGKLIRILGKLEEQSGDTFYINDGSGRAKAYIKDSTGIVKLKMALGDEIRVTGIVSQYGFLKSGDGNYRVLPRLQGDIYNKTSGKKVEESILGASVKLTELPVTGTPLDYYTIGWTLIFLGFSGRLWVQRKIEC